MTVVWKVLFVFQTIQNSYFCRYRDFRFPPGHPRQYEYTMYYWHVIAAKMAFIIVVEVGANRYSPRHFPKIR